jgi:MraZ protein
MFRGNHPTRVDDKGRLKVPADFKRRVDELYGPQFFITSKDGRRAELYPMKEWERIEDALAKAPTSAAKKKLVEMDGQGRLLIPQLLRETASLAGDVAVLGLQTYLAVANDEKHKASLAENPLTDEDMDTLGSFGV